MGENTGQTARYPFIKLPSCDTCLAVSVYPRRYGGDYKEERRDCCGRPAVASPTAERCLTASSFVSSPELPFFPLERVMTAGCEDVAVREFKSVDFPTEGKPIIQTRASPCLQETADTAHQSRTRDTKTCMCRPNTRHVVHGSSSPHADKPQRGRRSVDLVETSRPAERSTCILSPVGAGHMRTHVPLQTCPLHHTQAEAHPQRHKYRH